MKIGFENSNPRRSPSKIYLTLKTDTLTDARNTLGCIKELLTEQHYNLKDKGVFCCGITKEE